MNDSPGNEPEATPNSPVRPTDEPPGSSFPDIEPMSMSLLGKLFGVPLLIIGTIVGGAVTVVFLFGAPAASQERPVEELLNALEANLGQRSMGLLLPREKEHWQAGLELSVRLRNGEFSGEELDMIARRVTKMVNTSLLEIKGNHGDRNEVSRGQAEGQRPPGATHLGFLIRSLGHIPRPSSVETLVQTLATGVNPYVAYAIEGLANLKELPAARASVKPILEALDHSSDAMTRLVACAGLSVLAEPGDRVVIEALDRVRLSEDGEVGWSAALAMARLGSDEGKLTLEDLIDQSFWESADRYVKVDNGVVHRYPMPPDRVDAWLMASMEAAANLQDEDLWRGIERLKSNGRSPVRAKAAALLIDRQTLGLKN